MIHIMKLYYHNYLIKVSLVRNEEVENSLLVKFHHYSCEISFILLYELSKLL